ncbi:MAG: TIR domain-containing protein [Anaerolineaceae bacterium]|nr:TIR domain-containing protein [Anaerolineaceae bacterium]
MFSLKSYGVRHKVFISYHHADQDEVDNFINTYDHDKDVFIARALGAGLDETIIQSDDTDYVMRRIRELYLKDSTITIVLIGKCTWARRYVDWEIQSSLRSGETVIPNGLIGIVLPSAGRSPIAPERLQLNLKGDKADEGYARWYWYPTKGSSLAAWIENAFQARTMRRNLIVNPRDRFTYNRSC